MEKKVVMRLTSRLLVMVTTLLMIACGGQGSGGDGELIGAGFHGTSASGAAIAQASIVIREKGGTKVSTRSNQFGKFSSEALAGAGPFLLRVTQNNGNYLYSIGHKTVAEEEQLTVNLHPYTDLIVRNWFGLQGMDIDSEFESDGLIAQLPELDEINDIKSEIAAIIAQALISNNSPAGFDLISSTFDADHTGFDAFLANSKVIINKGVINLLFTNVENNIQNIVIDNIALATDLTEQSNQAPSTPLNVRALVASESEAVVSWEASSDDVGVASYRVYRNGNLIATTAYTSYLDAGLEVGVDYSYQLEAVDGRGLVSGKSNATVEISLDAGDNTPPPSATDLALLEDDGIVNLSWQQSEINDVFGFRLMRGSSGNVTQALAELTSTKFTDFSVMPANEYCYSVITFDAAGNESVATAESCITTSGTVTPSFLEFSATIYQVAESTASVDISVNRVGDSSEAVSVDYNVSGLSATAGLDFIATSGTLNWQAGDLSVKAISVQILQDSLVEGDETINLELFNASTNSSLGNTIQATLTINDVVQAACVDLIETTITVDTTLSLPCYKVKSTINVSNAATLTIQPGVTLKFAAGLGLTIETDGVLNATGAIDQPITFTSELAAPGYWAGIEIESVVPSIIDHCIVEYGGSSNSFNPANIGLSFDGKASIENSTIRYSESYGLALDNGETLTAFNNNTLTLNQEAPVYINANSVNILGADSDYSGNTKDYIKVVDDIADSQTWNLLDVDYHMPSIRMEVNATLTLEPGITLVFPANTQLAIDANGTLKALGTELQPITFTGLEEYPGYWMGNQFTSNNNANEMNHTIVEYGGGPNGNTEANVGVFGSNSRLKLTNSTLRHSKKYGFEFYQDISLTMDNVISTNNAQPGSIYFRDIGQLSSNGDYSGNSDDRVEIAYSSNATINSNQLVKNVGIPYYVPYNYPIYVEAALSFEPGVEIQLNAGAGFNIDQYGSLTAQGTSEEPIIFTGAQKNKGYWNGFQFTWSNSTENIFDYTIIEYAGAPSGNTEALIGFYGNEQLPTNGNVTNSILRGSASNGISKHTSTTGDFSTGNTFIDIDGLATHAYP